jgi:transposase
MAKALSTDLRERVVAAIDGGMSRRQAAARFGVSASSAIRWDDRRRREGHFRAKALGGDRRSARIEAHAGTIWSLIEAEPDLTLAELQARLGERGVRTSVSGLWRFLKRYRITRKKSPRTPASRTGRIS